MVTIRQKDKIKKNSFENDAWQQQMLVVGIDEVGRGSYAGPVLAAAVILPSKAHRMLKDSKIMTKLEREKACLWIKKNCAYGIGVAHHRIVTERNIWHATLIAMKKALVNLLQICPVRPAMVVTDAMPLDLSDTSFADIPVYYFPKGESKSSSIAAASIIAKVTRDAMMDRYDQAIPGYGWASNKGYGTPAHKKIIKTDNYSFIHRRGFVQNFLNRKLESDDQNDQLDILAGSNSSSSFV